MICKISTRNYFFNAIQRYRSIVCTRRCVPFALLALLREIAVGSLGGMLAVALWVLSYLVIPPWPVLINRGKVFFL